MSLHRVLQVHNLQLSPGGVDLTIEREGDLLREAGWEVDQFFVDNRQLASMSKTRAGAKAIWNREAVAELIAVAKRVQPDIVHVYTPFPIMSPAVFRAASRLGIPTVASPQSFRYSCVKATCFRDGEVCELCIGSRTNAPAVRYRCYKGSVGASAALGLSLSLHHVLGTFRNVDQYIAPSDFFRRMMIRDGFPADRIKLKPYPVPDPGPPTVDRFNQVVFIGRLVEEKGIATLLEAWPKVTAGTKLIVIGDGPLRHLVEAILSEDSRVEYRGWQDPTIVIETLRRSRFLVFPSEWYEGLGVAWIESFACGVPVIASNVGHFSEAIVEGVVGRQFQSGDSDSLAEVLQDALDRPAEAKRMGDNAREEYLRTFSPGPNRAALVTIYESLLR